MIRLIFLIGLPGSGKSSLARQLVKECSERRLVSTDVIRSQLFGDEAVQGPWLLVWREVGCQFRQSVQLTQQGIVRETIYDATNVICKQRRQSLALARESGFTHITGVWLNTPVWLCLWRNQQRDRHVPQSVIQRMNYQMCAAPPSEQDGFDCLIQFTPFLYLSPLTCQQGTEIAPPNQVEKPNLEE